MILQNCVFSQTFNPNLPIFYTYSSAISVTFCNESMLFIPLFTLIDRPVNNVREKSISGFLSAMRVTQVMSHGWAQKWLSHTKSSCNIDIVLVYFQVLCTEPVSFHKSFTATFLFVPWKNYIHRSIQQSFNYFFCFVNFVSFLLGIRAIL